MSVSRDFNAEFSDDAGRKYAYGFDFDVMHHYMVEAFRPHLRPGKALELGSFKGDFTKRLLPLFPEITCVEASNVALSEARSRLPSSVQLVEGTFESVVLNERFHNVFLTHVLEHVEDPIQVLRRINRDWLAADGRLFLVCPNANAASRQIAVRMGVVATNSAVTEAEARHGHHRTYSLDTLERDAVTAGLRIVSRSGIFFKALANFQWDQVLKAGIVSSDYLDGCFEIGQIYPDLCASIFLLCERGEIE